jgi:CMP-N-acetylneuraminic acid synthetase
VSVIAAVFARGGSKGVPDKNQRLFDGRPLVVHAIEQAAACQQVERVIVSTDSEEIAELARAAGAEVPWLRPESLSGDTAREWDAWRHLLGWLDENGDIPERLLVVPCTAPLRIVDDLQRCVDASLSLNADVVLTVTASHRNPWFNMVTLDQQGFARLVLEPERRIHRRQDAPPTFDVGTVAFVVNPTYVQKADSLYDGTVIAVEVPAERSLDIDTETDLAFAEFLLQRSRTTEIAEATDD